MINQKYNIYIITCNKSSHILNVTIPLLDKYWNIPKSVKILGFGNLNINLPSEYEFISMRPAQLSILNWGKDIASVISKDKNELAIFMLDDFLPIDYVDARILNILLKNINDDSVFRCSLGIDMHFQGYYVIEKFDDFDLIEMNVDAQYRVTTQPSIWKIANLVKYLNNSTSPWNFEVSNNPKNRVLGTLNKYAFKWINESALSGRHPNKFNILGLKFDDVKWLISKNLLDETILQYGNHVGKVPQFNKYGYTFKLDILKNFVNDTKFKQYLLKYSKSY